MIFRYAQLVVAFILVAFCLNGCMILHESSKHGFIDGIYTTKRLSDREVYVLRIDDDTIAVFPVLEFKDSTAILTNKRVNYTNLQKKMKDDKVSRTFYHPSFDIDVMTIPATYRPPVHGVPGQLTTNFNGALYLGYRIDEYKLNYKRTPLNVYKQSVKHIGYSAGLFAGIGNTSINSLTLDNPAFLVEYEGVLFITGVAANVAVGNLTFGISCGPDFLLDKYHEEWVYEGKPCIGFTFGLNLN